MKDLYFCTIASKDRLAHVKVLAESLLTHHPEAPLFFLLVDNIENFFDPLSLKKNIELIKARKLKNVPNITELFFKYNAFEASTALKPYFCEYLLKTYNMRKLVRLKNLTQHFGILWGVLKEGVRDEEREVSAVSAA